MIVDPSRTIVVRDGTAGGLRRLAGGAGAGRNRAGEGLVNGGSESCLGASRSTKGGVTGSSNTDDAGVFSCKSPERVVCMFVERDGSAECRLGSGLHDVSEVACSRPLGERDGKLGVDEVGICLCGVGAGAAPVTERILDELSLLARRNSWMAGFGFGFDFFWCASS